MKTPVQNLIEAMAEALKKERSRSDVEKGITAIYMDQESERKLIDSPDIEAHYRLEMPKGQSSRLFFDGIRLYALRTEEPHLFIRVE